MWNAGAWASNPCGGLLTIAAGAREAWSDWLRGRRRRLCARVAWPTLLGDPSALPLDGESPDRRKGMLNSEMRGPVADKLSMVRVKSVILTTIFMAGWVGFAGHILAPAISSMPSSPSGSLSVMAAMGSAAVLFYFVRCETCHSIIHYTAGGKRTLWCRDEQPWPYWTSVVLKPTIAGAFLFGFTTWRN